MRRLRTHLKNPRAWRLVGLVIVMLGTTGLVAAGPVVPPGVRAPLAALLAAFAYSVTLLPPAGRVIDHSARLVVVIPLGLSAITWLSHATDGDPAWAIVAGVAAVIIQVYVAAGMFLRQQVLGDEDHNHDADTTDREDPRL